MKRRSVPWGRHTSTIYGRSLTRLDRPRCRFSDILDRPRKGAHLGEAQGGRHRDNPVAELGTTNHTCCGSPQVTLKAVAVFAFPLVVTTLILAVVAPAGTMTWISLASSRVQMVPATPLKVTEVAPRRLAAIDGDKRPHRSLLWREGGDGRTSGVVVLGHRLVSRG